MERRSLFPLLVAVPFVPAAATRAQQAPVGLGWSPAGS